MPVLNPAGAEIVAIELAGEIAVSSKELFPAPDGFFDMPGCDIRVALFKGRIADLVAPNLDVISGGVR